MPGPFTRVAFAAGVLGAVALLAGCQGLDTAGGTSDTGTAPPTLTTSAAPGTPAPGTPAPTTGASTPNLLNRSWVMPNLVGTNLQDAQNQIQKLTHDEVFFTSSHDATGQGRHQILDRDWKVCSQNVPAGAAITITTKIDFGAAKTAEACP